MSTISRTSTHTMYETVTNKAKENLSKTTEISKQISTGQTYDRFAKMTDKIPLFIDTQNMVREFKQYEEVSQTVSNKLTLISQSLDSIYNIAVDFRSQLLQAKNPGMQNGRIDIYADNAKKNIAAALNIKIGDAYLFAGDDISSMPVQIDPASESVAYYTAGDYYTGSQNTLNEFVNQKTAHNYGIKADEGWIRNLLTALHRISTNPYDATEQTNALNEINNSLDGVIQAEATVGHQLKTFEEARDILSESQYILKEQLAQTNSADIAFLSLLQEERRLTLDASYKTVAALQKMSLVNYL